MKLVFLIDKNLFFSGMVELTLKPLDINVSSFPDFQNIFPLLELHRPDLLLLDMNTLLEKGQEFFLELKNHPQTKSIPVVVLGGNEGNLPDLPDWMNGLTGFLPKPISPSEFKERIIPFFK